MPDLYLPLLVLRAQASDRAALEELIRLHHARLRAFLHKMLPNQNHTDDLAQDVWIDVFRDLPRLSDPAAFRPWLYRIARNRAFRVLRGGRGREPMTTIEDFDVASDDTDDADFTAEDAQAVHAALDQLAA